MVTVRPGPPGNYVITCVCGLTTKLASLSDVGAAEVALDHVKTMQRPTVEELFDRLGEGL
jgi:hypothetical protein